MTEQREDLLELCTPWKPGTEHYEILDSDDCRVLGGDADDAIFPNEATRDHIIACVNFCRKLRTEFLEQHTLANIENFPYVSGMFLLEKDGGEK